MQTQHTHPSLTHAQAAYAQTQHNASNAGTAAKRHAANAALARVAHASALAAQAKRN